MEYVDFENAMKQEIYDYCSYLEATISFPNEKVDSYLLL